jgi:hypothetical protein
MGSPACSCFGGIGSRRKFELDGVAASPVDFVWGTGFAADSPLRARGGVR